MANARRARPGRSDDTLRVGRVLFPAIRWDAARGFAPAAREIDAALALGVGGFIVFGGPALAVAELTADLRARSAAPLLIGADLERGAGQQFAGAVSLPPAAALGALDDPGVTRRAGELTAREARALGVDWIYAPVADLDAEPANPIVGTRAYGADPALVSAHVAAWIEGCRSAGALACAKHFPGHGRTVTDSHLELPVVGASRAVLEDDLRPFRAAIQRGVEAVMTAHVGYPALATDGRPATLSSAIVTGLLREELGFRGLVVTDALNMAGVLGGDGGEASAAVLGLAAGCDALLCPTEPARIVTAIELARGGTLADSRIPDAVRRVEEACRRSAVPRPEGWGRPEDRDWALGVALRVLRSVRGAPTLPGRRLDLITIDDDAGGPFPSGPRTAFPETLAAAGIDVRQAATAERGRPAAIAVYADIRGWKGRPHVSAAAQEQIRRALAVRPDAPVVLFGHPRLAPEVPGPSILAAWGGDTVMQEAAARWLADRVG